MSKKIKKLEAEVKRLSKVNSKLRLLNKKITEQLKNQQPQTINICCPVCDKKATCLPAELPFAICPRCGVKAKIDNSQ